MCQIDRHVEFDADSEESILEPLAALSERHLTKCSSRCLSFWTMSGWKSVGQEGEEKMKERNERMKNLIKKVKEKKDRSMCVCICVCVWERKKERKKEGERERERERERSSVCVWERKRERERKKEGEREREREK